MDREAETEKKEDFRYAQALMDRIDDGGDVPSDVVETLDLVFSRQPVSDKAIKAFRIFCSRNVRI